MAFGLVLRCSKLRKGVTRVSDAGSHRELWIAADGESGNDNVVGNAMITNSEAECDHSGVGSR